MADETTKIVVKGAGRYDGEYELDTDRAFNAREWNWIKRIAGYMPNTISDGFNGGDPDLYVALTVVAMARDGRIDRTEGVRVAETLAELPFDGAGIQIIFPDTEPDAPLALTGAPEQSSPNGSPEKTLSSGPGSESGTTNPAPTPSPTGTSGSDTSAPRPLPTLSAS
jgi:hypothetical protein